MSKTIYEIMHRDRRVAAIDTAGHCRIYEETFMPYDLYLEEEEDIDTLVDNVTNWNYWCATRVLTLDRKYAKEILNSIGMLQAVTDRDRARIALTYRCASLTDVFWVRLEGEPVSFSQVNLYENHLEDTFIDIALKGRQYTVENSSLARDLATDGCFPKAWRRVRAGRAVSAFQLLKDGGDGAVERELLASQICRCFDVSQVLYERGYFDGEAVSVSDNMTSIDYSIASMAAVTLYAQNHDLDLQSYILSLDRHGYYMMNIIDYLVGNTDRHWGNWGVLVDNRDNQPVSLHKLMDFNHAFRAYDQIDGANCQTVSLRKQRKLTQREAAIEAVEQIGLNQIREIGQEVFIELPQYRDMFYKRLEILKNVVAETSSGRSGKGISAGAGVEVFRRTGGENIRRTR